MHFLLYKKRSAKDAHAFAEENVAYSDAKAALACRKRHALLFQYLFVLVGMRKQRRNKSNPHMNKEGQ